MSQDDTPAAGGLQNNTQDILIALYIQVSRIYDVLMLQLDKDQRDMVEEWHSAGKLIGPDPALIDDDDC